MPTIKGRNGRKSNKSMATPPGAPAPVGEAPAVHTGQGEAELAKLMKSGLDSIKGHIVALDDRVAAVEARKATPALVEVKDDLDSDQIQTAIQAQVDSLKSAIEGRVDQIEASILSRVPAGEVEEIKTWAAKLHDSPEFKNASRDERGRILSRFSAPVESLSAGRRGWGAKATAIMGPTELGPLLVPFHRVPVAELLTEFSDIVSFVPRVPIAGKDTYDFRRETEASRLGYVRTTLTANVLAIDTTINVAEVEGLEEGTFLRIFDSTGALLGSVEILSIAVLVVTLTGQAGFTATSGDLVTSENYGATAELAQKPGAHLEFVTKTLNMKTIAILLALTQQRLDSLPQFEGFVENKLRMRARRNLSWHLLYGDNTDAGQWAGYDSEVGAQTYLWSTGESKDFRADAVVRAAALIFSGNQLVVHMNIRDWHRLKLEKSTLDEHYVLTNMGPMIIVDQPGARALGPHLVNIDGAVRAADFFVIDHALASEWPDSDTSAFSVGFINDDFEKNIVRTRYEDRGNHAILTTTAYVNGEWDSQPA
jgi:hypothetical protein